MMKQKVNKDAPKEQFVTKRDELIDWLHSNMAPGTALRFALEEPGRTDEPMDESFDKIGEGRWERTFAKAEPPPR